MYGHIHGIPKYGKCPNLETQSIFGSTASQITVGALFLKSAGGAGNSSAAQRVFGVIKLHKQIVYFVRPGGIALLYKVRPRAGGPVLHETRPAGFTA